MRQRTEPTLDDFIKLEDKVCELKSQVCELKGELARMTKLVQCLVLKGSGYALKDEGETGFKFGQRVGMILCNESRRLRHLVYEGQDYPGKELDASIIAAEPSLFEPL